MCALEAPAALGVFLDALLPRAPSAFSSSLLASLSAVAAADVQPKLRSRLLATLGHIAGATGPSHASLPSITRYPTTLSAAHIALLNAVVGQRHQVRFRAGFDERLLRLPLVLRDDGDGDGDASALQDAKRVGVLALLVLLPQLYPSTPESLPCLLALARAAPDVALLVLPWLESKLALAARAPAWEVLALLRAFPALAVGDVGAAAVGLVLDTLLQATQTVAIGLRLLQELAEEHPRFRVRLHQHLLQPATPTATLLEHKLARLSILYDVRSFVSLWTNQRPPGGFQCSFCSVSLCSPHRHLYRLFTRFFFCFASAVYNYNIPT